MRRPCRATLAVLWFAAFVGGSGVAAPAHAEPIWGINGHPFTAYPGVTVDQQLDYIRDLGLKSYRVNLREPDELGELLDKAKAHGITLLPVFTPQFDLDKETPEVLYDMAYNLAHGFVSRFKDDIRVWELGNELENYAIIKPCEMQDDGKEYNCGWGPASGSGPLHYYGPRWAKVSAVLKGLSEGTAAADPSARRAMGTAGWGHIGAFTRMERDGIKWDISVWHMYGEDPEWAFRQLAAFGRSIWVTEFNHPHGSTKSAEEQAAGLKRTIERLRALAPLYRVEAAHVYELLDEPYWAPSYEANMGLVTVEKDGDGWKPGAAKPAYEAVKAALRGAAGSKGAARSEAEEGAAAN